MPPRTTVADTLVAARVATQRKIVTVCLVPMGLTFVSQTRRRTPLASLLLLSANWCLVGFVAHLLLRRAAGLPAAA